MYYCYWFLAVVAIQTMFACSHAELHNETCILLPSTFSCSNYSLPELYVEQGIQNQCANSNDSMPGCTVDSICKQSSYSSSSFCQSFRIYKELCEDMEMGGCEDYTSMCTSNSVVEECQLKILPLPSSAETVTMISSICKEMDMEMCTECPWATNPQQCDLLTVYSTLCKSMPDMSQCSSWNSICELVPSWPICDTNESSTGPIMRMYFHWGIYDYVLFMGWVPTSNGQYVGTLMVVAIMGIIMEVIKVFRCYCEYHWEQWEKLPDERKTFFAIPFRPKIDLIRGICRTLETAWGLVIMLAIMNFNAGIFFALCFGSFVGNVAFGRFIGGNSSSSSTAGNCCGT